MFGRALAVEDGPERFGKGLPTSLTTIALHPFAGLAEFFKVLLLTVLTLAIVRAGFIRTKISWFGKLLQASPSDDFAQSLHHSTSTLKRETIKLVTIPNTATRRCIAFCIAFCISRRLDFCPRV